MILGECKQRIIEKRSISNDSKMNKVILETLDSMLVSYIHIILIDVETELTPIYNLNVYENW